MTLEHILQSKIDGITAKIARIRREKCPLIKFFDCRAASYLYRIVEHDDFLAVYVNFGEVKKMLPLQVKRIFDHIAIDYVQKKYLGETRRNNSDRKHLEFLLKGK